MNKLNTKTIAFNGAGILLGVGLLGYVVKDALTTEQMPGCVERYPVGTEFSLIGEDGAPMSPIELQARTGITSVGILENASVIQTPKSGKAVLQVSLNSRKTLSEETSDPGGIGFNWSPSQMQQANAACLSYKVWLPKKFEFGQGGLLFGLAGGPQEGEDTAIASRVEWREKGQGQLRLRIAGSEKFNSSGTQKFRLRAGGWTSVQQEVVLNTPGKPNGALRLWLNGDLVINRTNIAWRKQQDVTLSNVQADIRYLLMQGRSKSKVSSKLRLSPPVVSWR